MNPAALAHPEWLGTLAWIAALCALAVAAARAAARSRRRRLLGRRTPLRAPHLAGDAAVFAALVAIALALLGPRLGERVVWVPSTGVDVVFLVDVSRSMDARDVPPSRLDRAGRAVEEILARLEPRDRAALAVFAGRGLLLTPLTPDRGALGELVAGLDTELLRPVSSDLGAGVRAALSAFEAASQRPRVLFVASDGEDPERRRDLGAADAARRRVRVITAAIGSEIGSRVPDGGRPLRDRDGQVVVSRRDRERLAELASATGGESFAGDEWGRIDSDRAARAIRRDAAAAPGERVARRVRAVRVAPFAAAAFALLLLEALPRPRRGRGADLALAVAAAPLLAGASLLAHGASGADPDSAHELANPSALAAGPRAAPEDARSLVDLGLARLERGRSEAAARAFLAAAAVARETRVAAVAYYDLGVAAIAQGELEAARDAFFDALALDPADREARFNLEWTLTALRRRPAPPEREPARPEEEPPPEAKAAPPERRAPTAAEAATALPSLDAEQRRRWLERAADDPRQWLRAAARTPDDTRRPPPAAAW